MLTSILNIWSPDLGDQYALTQDLAAMAEDIETAIINPPYTRITSTGGVNPSSTTHGLQIGPDNNFNLAVGARSLMARESGSVADFTINASGGDITLGNNTSTVNLSGRLNGSSLTWGFAAGEYVFAPITGGTSRTATINFPTNRFTRPPRIMVSLASNFPAVSAVSFSSESATSFDATYTYSGSGTFNAPRIHWYAVQMSPGSASG